MAVRYGYFNSVDGDRKYNAEDMTMYFKGLVSDGIYQTIGNMFAVTATSGLTVSIGTGRALVNMHWIECDAPFTITFDAASVSSDTYQLIVLRCNLADNVRSVGVFTKTSSDGSISLTNNDTITELCIARVRIRANASSISQSDIRDYRGSSYCPWITGLVKQVDVSQLNAQFYKYYEEQTAELEVYMAEQKASFDSWLSSLQNELQVNTKLKKYQYSYETTTENEREIPLISNYEDGDVLLVHINGVLYVEGDEFTIDTENQKIILKRPVTKDNLITQILIKSVIGDGSSGSKQQVYHIPFDGTDSEYKGDLYIYVSGKSYLATLDLDFTGDSNGFVLYSPKFVPMRLTSSICLLDDGVTSAKLRLNEDGKFELSRNGPQFSAGMHLSGSLSAILKEEYTG